MNTKEKIKHLQELRFKEIIDSDLPKLDKLKSISEEKLLPIHSWLISPFEEQEKLLKKEVLESGKSFCITDDFFTMRNFNKGSVEDFGNLEYWLEDIEEDELIEIVTARGSDLKVEVNKETFIDTIYNFCITNKIIGFYYDW